MTRLFSLPGAFLVLMLLLAAAAGCSNKGSNVKLSTVQGKVTLDSGEPVTGGYVTFHPSGGTSAQAAASTGEIKSDGTYKIQTGGKDGAPEGSYKVTVSPPMVSTGGSPLTTPFDKSYTRVDTTQLTVTVPGNYDLKLKK